MKINALKKKEEDLYKLKHSKPEPKVNSWKFSNHILEEFGKYEADLVHSFTEEKKKKFLIEEPYKIPKKEGDYFEKGVKLI